MSVVRVAVVDTGIAFGHPHVQGDVRGVSLVGDDRTDVADRVGHGTAVAAAIREKAPGVELIAVRVFEQQLATTARLLAGGIEWAVAEGCTLVNLSVGTANEVHVPLFEAAIRRAAERGVLIVAAAGAREAPWFPGSLPGVVGVVADPACGREDLRMIALGGRRFVAASPHPRPIAGVPVQRNLAGVSFAVANVTGLLAQALTAGAVLTTVEAVHRRVGGDVG